MIDKKIYARGMTVNEYARWRYRNNRDKILARNNGYREENREKVLKGKREYYQKNKEYISEWKRKYRERNAEVIKLKKKLYHEKNKVIISEKSKIYYREKYRTTKRAYDKIYYQENKESIKKNVKRWSKTDKGKQLAKIQLAKRRSKIKKNGGSFTYLQWLELMNRVEGNCPCCNEHFGSALTVDHIVPLSKGGSNFITNIQPLCKSCNSTKHDKTINYLK